MKLQIPYKGKTLCGEKKSYGRIDNTMMWEKGKEMVSGQVWDAKSLFAVIGLESAKDRSRGEI